ncbi:succinate dehydrogenase cytochrome b subunit [Streptomyces fractus]|uniref:succinate dehydrogenase cytochrome b subunit n=1 Tax=Streptomyces fractus TaxID=641806 RepID=UPI003CF298EB
MTAVSPHKSPSRIRAYWQSSVGKKQVMAVTGLLMILFLVAHMVGNLKIFVGEDAYNHYSQWLKSLGTPAIPYGWSLWIIGLVLGICVVLHGTAAYQLARRAKRGRGRYVHKRPSTGYATHTMRYGGIVIALFVVWHILDLTFLYLNPAGIPGEPYGNVVADFQPDHWWITVFYLLALVFMGLHIRHGFWALTQSMGWCTARNHRALRATSSVLALLLTAGFMIVPLAVTFGIVS